MPKAKNAPTQSTVEGLFAGLMSGDKSVTRVSSVVTSGKRWDYAQKEVADKVIVVHRYHDIETQYGPAYLVDIDVEGEQATLLAGGEVLIKQLVEMVDYLPMVAVIRKPGRCYVFTDPTPEEIAAYVEEYLGETEGDSELASETPEATVEPDTPPEDDISL